jgi:DNA-binding MarR family transcriptional regulator
MLDKSPVHRSDAAEPVLAEETLETSRLIVEFLHAAYATRNQDGAGLEPTGEVSGHAAERSGVSPHAVRAAMHINQHGERTIGQVSTGLGISYGWASRVVEELEQIGYVKRERDSDDRRVVRVRLVEGARDEVERAYRWHGQSVEEALSVLSRSDRAAVRTFLRRLSDVLRQESAEPV